MNGDAPATPGEADSSPPGAVETVRSVRNAITLGASLVVTWTLALGVRLFLPRSLGPALFGEFNFADVLAGNSFILLSLGLDTYIQKELPARPKHASDFVGGVLLVRAVGSILLFVGLAAMLTAMGRPISLIRTVIVFGFAHLSAICSNTFATLLYVSQRVGRLAMLNVASKVVWAAGLAAAILSHASLEWFALALLLSDLLRMVVLYSLVRGGFELRVDLPSTWKVIVASAPFYVVGLAVSLYAKIDVNIMGMMMPDKEVGYYSSAGNISGVAMLMAPLMGSVLMPQLSRAAARSREELNAMFRRSIEWLLAAAVPISLMLTLGADFIVINVFGAKFLPAINSLRILAPLFVPLYLAMLASTYLNLTDRSWRVTWVTLIALTLNALLNLMCIGPTYRALGEGGAGIAAATFSVLCEALVCIALMAIVGAHAAWDRRSVICAVKLAGACVVVSFAHVAMHELGPVRLVIDFALYSVLTILTGAVHVRELYEILTSAFGKRRNAA